MLNSLVLADRIESVGELLSVGQIMRRLAGSKMSSIWPNRFKIPNRILELRRGREGFLGSPNLGSHGGAIESRFDLGCMTSCDLFAFVIYVDVSAA